MENARIIVLENYKPSGHSCGKVHDIDGISSTVMENHGAVIAILEEIYENIEDTTGNKEGIH